MRFITFTLIHFLLANTIFLEAEWIPSDEETAKHSCYEEQFEEYTRRQLLSSPNHIVEGLNEINPFLIEPW